MHKAGFVNIIGNPNVGKSTLMNALVGEKLSIITAKERFNVEGLFRTILDLLPEGPSYYPDNTLTDKPMRFFASEIIREKILRFYDKEIPYCCEIGIESYKEEPAIDRIVAIIHVARESQKGILIGRGGSMLKKVGQAAREDIEKFLDKKVFLQLLVKVSDDWREKMNEEIRREVHFKATGSSRFRATANGDPTSLRPFH